jgi:hypothetical protein
MLTKIELDKAKKKLMMFAASAVFIKYSDTSRHQSVVSGKIGVPVKNRFVPLYGIMYRKVPLCHTVVTVYKSLPYVL